MCLTVGMIGGPYVKGMVGKVKKTPVRSVTFRANLERIAVINLDTGVEKKGEQIYYAAKLIEYPDESYQTTSLEEAKDGMKKDLYGAYIIIPSTFSTAVDSINGTPQKAVFEYQINPHLEGQDRDNMIYELTAFQDSIRNNVSYVFLDAILKEVHNVQDGSMTILANDDSERENLSGVSAEELIQTVEFTELKENNEVISPMGGWLSGFALFWKVIINHEKVEFHSSIFGIGRSYPLKDITKVCYDEVKSLKVYKGNHRVFRVYSGTYGSDDLVEWFAEEGFYGGEWYRWNR